jgi:hypothetical protein
MTSTLGIAIAIWTASAAVAQSPMPPRFSPPASRPTFSPYLNMLDRNNSPALNYYGRVRPQTEFRAQVGQLQRQIVTRDERDASTTGGLVTGHPAYFFYYAPYFGGGAGSPTATAPPAAPRQGGLPPTSRGVRR